jgi:hypothetical protein
MPTVTLSDTTYRKLQKAAKPFIDTEDSVCSRVLDFYFEHSTEAPVTNGAPSPNGALSPNGNGSGGSAGAALRLEPESRQLAHTKLISAAVDGTPLHRPKWNSLMNDLHIMARKRLGSFEAVQKASHANLRQGCYEENGYKYLPEADLSIQGVDANLACDHSFRLAKAMNVSLKVTFKWRDKEDAAHPRETGIVEWTPMDAG